MIFPDNLHNPWRLAGTRRSQSCLIWGGTYESVRVKIVGTILCTGLHDRSTVEMIRPNRVNEKASFSC